MLELLHATIGTHDLSCGQHWTWHVCSFLGWVEFITEGSSILIGFAPKDHSRLQVIIGSILVLYTILWVGDRLAEGQGQPPTP